MSDVKFSKEHEWIKLDDDTATIGITKHATEMLGDIVFVELPTIGKQVSSNDEVCVIESVKAASDIYTPIDGEIIEVNEKLNDNGALVNEDPENTAWIFKLKISEASQFNDLMTLSEYQEFLKTEET